MSKGSLGAATFALLIVALAFAGGAKADTVYVDGSYAFPTIWGNAKRASYAILLCGLFDANLAWPNRGK